MNIDKNIYMHRQKYIYRTKFLLEIYYLGGWHLMGYEAHEICNARTLSLNQSGQSNNK
jgi:hypothetical protein